MKGGQKSPSSPQLPATAPLLQLQGRKGGKVFPAPGCIPDSTAHGTCACPGQGDSEVSQGATSPPLSPLAHPDPARPQAARPAVPAEMWDGLQDPKPLSNLNDSMTQNDSVPAQVPILPPASCAAPSLSHLAAPSCLQLCQGRCVAFTHGRGWDVMIPKVASDPNHSVIL